MARQKIPSALWGLVTGWDENGLPAIGVGVPAIAYLDTGAKLGIFAQTANTSAGDVAGQALGTIKVPSGTADGAVITLTNALITTSSYIFFQQKDSGNKKIIFDTIVPGTGSATFKVKTMDAAALTADCDVWYMIWN